MNFQAPGVISKSHLASGAVRQTGFVVVRQVEVCRAGTLVSPTRGKKA